MSKIQTTKTIMTTVGLDLSLTHTGIAVVTEKSEVIYSGVIKSKPSGNSLVDETKRIIKIVDVVMERINYIFTDNNLPSMVLIEGLAFMAKGTSLAQLSGLNYLIRVKLIEKNIPFMIVAPTTLKKFITGSGKGDKDLMMMSVYKNYGFESMDNNECDAYALAVCGLATLECPINTLTIPQSEVVKLLKKQL